MFAYVGGYGKLERMGALQTDRLSLQPFDERHIQSMHELCVQPAVRRYLFKDQIIPVTQVEAMVSASQENFEALGAGYYAVVVDEPGHANYGEFAGFCGIRPFEDSDEVELLFGMDPAIWGRGFGREAADAVLAHGYQNCSLPRVLAAADTPNQRSVRVLQKLGMSFRERREWHGWDTMFYEMTAEDYACR